MKKIMISEQTEKKHQRYYRKRIIQDLMESKGESYAYESAAEIRRVSPSKYFNENRFVKQHSYFVGFVKNRYKTFATGKLSDLAKLKETIEIQFPLVCKMLRLKLDGLKYNYKEYLYRLFGYEQFKVDDLFNYFNKEAQKSIGKEIYCAKVQAEIVRMLEGIFPQHKNEINARLLPGGQSLLVDQCKMEFRKLHELNITIDNFKQFPVFKNYWNDYFFVMESALRVCPYCNRQYITPLYSDNGKIRADIDHFLPKSIYPYFSMSLYNLVPVCKSCNQSLKRDKEFNFNHISPYEDHIGDYFKFKANVVTNEISIKREGDKLDEIAHHLETFKIGPLYNYHRNQVKELIRKRIVYPDLYIKKLYEENRTFFNSEHELKQLIVGFIEDKSKINDEAFLKFRRDIAEQLGFLSSRNDFRIAKLREILNKSH
ncbi:HNH endonuclease domain-containing protein [Paenibacillus sp. BC26]|uniref:HNH endonuclease domain-containing protein n=1 Tax=Paenibacillus sp. BC26 TaxID=1881032 RepID=UPI0008E574C4|nr:HNH endonuclease domain-containing protein [Paenibacillus sp. BC26]SFT19145.1 HNH endonuclease [Paenibacillus sp. BC26]